MTVAGEREKFCAPPHNTLFEILLYLRRERQPAALACALCEQSQRQSGCVTARVHSLGGAGLVVQYVGKGRVCRLPNRRRVVRHAIQADRQRAGALVDTLAAKAATCIHPNDLRRLGLDEQVADELVVLRQIQHRVRDGSEA